jgi:hypothetical protein
VGTFKGFENNLNRPVPTPNNKANRFREEMPSPDQWVKSVE